MTFKRSEIYKRRIYKRRIYKKRINKKRKTARTDSIKIITRSLILSAIVCWFLFSGFPTAALSLTGSTIDSQDVTAKHTLDNTTSTAAPEPQKHSPKKRVFFIAPRADEMWNGDRKIKIGLDFIEDNEVSMVEFYLDGRLIREVTTPPFEITHSFGVEGQNRRLKVLVRGSGMKILASAERLSYQVNDSQSVEVKELVVPVVVTDKSGNYIRGLKKKDFILLADDRQMDLSLVKTNGTAQFNLAQVIDISFSMRYKIHDVLDASRGFVEQVMTGNDRGTMVFFNQRVFEHIGFTNDLEELEKRLNLKSPTIGGTALYDAIAYTLNLMNKTHGWNIIVVFSDGEDNSSYIDHFSLLKKVKKSPVIIYAIDNKGDAGNHILRSICKMTGGTLFPLDNTKKTKQVYDQIRKEIKAQYVLYFNPKIQGSQYSFNQFHTLNVTVKNHPEYNVRTIKGYY
jgi:VWFA-related protein